MPSKKSKPKKTEEARVALNVEDIRVDASPQAITSMISALIHIPSYRKSFEQNPVAHLKECGITVPNSVGKRITPESIRAALDELTEGGEEQTTAALPGVAVAVQVYTRPATSPGVRVGVNVATASSTFASVQPEAAAGDRPGLRARQKGEALKRQKRAKSKQSE